jgi:type VI secretion system protein ImpA
MAAPPLLDIAALLEPIPGDNPAGEKYIPQAIQDKLDDDRKEIVAEDGSPEEPRKADWKGVIRTSSEALRKTSKSLLIATRLVEGLVQLHGFAGLRVGLQLLHDMIEQCWDRLYPALSGAEEGESEEEAVQRHNDDLERRAGPFHWLDDADHGARFPNTIRMVPMFFGPEGAYGWNDWRQSVDGKGVPTDVFEKGVMATPAEKVEAELNDLSEARTQLNQLGQVLEARLGSVAPSFSSVRQAVEQCLGLLTEILHRKRPGGIAETHTTAEGGAAAASGGSVHSATTRAEAYRQLAQAAALLQELEPHSPIPYLVQRAVELGALPFPQLIKRLIRDAGVLTELHRELGLKDEAEPSS